MTDRIVLTGAGRRGPEGPIGPRGLEGPLSAEGIAARDEAIAAAAAALQSEQNATDISNIAVDDDIVELLVKPGAPGPKTKAALNDLYVQQGPKASGDTTGATDRAALVAAIAALPGGIGTIVLRRANYYLDTEVQIPNKVTLRGQGREATKVIAGSAFTAATGKSVLTLGTRAGGASPIFSSRVERMTVDGADTADFCVYSNQANEMSGAGYLNVNNFRVVGIEFASGCQNVRDVEAIEAYATAATAAVAGVRYTNVPGSCRIDGITSYGKTGAPMTAGVYASNTQLTARSVHSENCISGVDVGGPGAAVVIGASGPTATATLTNVVRMRGDSRYVTVMGIQKGNATNAVKDEFYNVTITDSYVPLAVMGAAWINGPLTTDPRRKAIAQTADANITSTTFVDWPLSISYTARTTKAVVTLTGAVSPSVTGAIAAYAVTNGTTQLACGAATGSSSNRQAVAGSAVFTGLTVGTTYTFQLRAKVSSGTLFCRPATVSDSEMLTLQVSDAT